ncbi:hypothetical protein V6N12_020384 [Hibiscus sabdariffa]|uniref:Protein kinase domain-containing protein n=1 Tax=Hibiscus sabdariffa TaxID=183260 RepID=A0ABR2CY04_9ROSI
MEGSPNESKKGKEEVKQESKKKGGSNLSGKLILGFTGGAISLLISCIIRKIPCMISQFTKSDTDIEAFIRNGTISPRRYTYSDVRKMTNSFHEQLGKGGYGSVFKGKLPDGHLVAVKLLNTTKGDGQDFINEVANENFLPKISDFGLAKLCTTRESIVSMLEARGTIGYIAPEVFCRSVGGVSHKSDVYSYGMVILEMVGGRKNVDVGVSQTEEIYFPHWIYGYAVQDDMEPQLLGLETKEETEIARKMILVGLWCIQTNPLDRPTMSRVIEMLEGSVQVLQIPPKPYMSSPSTSPVDSAFLTLS